MIKCYLRYGRDILNGILSSQIANCHLSVLDLRLNDNFFCINFKWRNTYATQF